MDAERGRIARIHDQPWRKWGPYLSERQWGTVREDYSSTGDAWNYVTHDQARSRAYRWGEDGIAGISDDNQILCFALALWNGKDPFLKERLFGLTNQQGNHGEDIKEYYFYLDNTPTHSYMQYLYKYPQAAFPYEDLVVKNKARTRKDPEYELIETGVFDDNRYFDVFVEYAKESTEDIFIRITVHNRGNEPAGIHILPTLWYRNRWSWPDGREKPRLEKFVDGPQYCAVHAFDEELGDRWFYCEGSPSLLFTENENNNVRLFGSANAGPYTKDGINNFVVNRQRDAVNPNLYGTKVAPHYRTIVELGKPAIIRLRLTSRVLSPTDGEDTEPFGRHFDDVIMRRRQEADQFYAALLPSSTKTDIVKITRQALAGMLWGKQFYHYDIERWLNERRSIGFGTIASNGRNQHWTHICNADVISTPDKWEYPCYAAWDLAFHVVPLSLVDPEFAKSQIDLMLSERYLHPSGQLPADEWNFGNTHPPVLAWATIFLYRLLEVDDSTKHLRWLEQAFRKLLLNFTWWANRHDKSGRTSFEGGFISSDGLTLLDRGSPLPTGGYLEQADGVAWMAFYTQNMLDIASVLLEKESRYIDMVFKFLEHFMRIASAMTHIGDRSTSMWDEKDGFFYNMLHLGDGNALPLKVRSIVGLIPLCAVTTFDGRIALEYPEITNRFRRFLKNHPNLSSNIHDLRKVGHRGHLLVSILDERRLRLVLERMLDEKEFLSPYGVRSLSRFHAGHPYIFKIGEEEYRISYLPGESDTQAPNGNFNWRGPIWMPINALIIRALLLYYRYYGNDFQVECPTGSGRMMNLYEVANELTERLTSIFLKTNEQQRPVIANLGEFSKDPHWCDYIPFHEYFHAETGFGLGASHQTGWTGIIASAIHLFATTDAEEFLEDRFLYRRRLSMMPPQHHDRRVAERRHSVTGLSQDHR